MASYAGGGCSYTVSAYDRRRLASAMPICPASRIGWSALNIDEYGGMGGGMSGGGGGGGGDDTASARMLCRSRASSSGGRGSGFMVSSIGVLAAALDSPYGPGRPPSSWASFGGSGNVWLGGSCSEGMFAIVSERPTRDLREFELVDDAALDGRSRSNEVANGDDVGPSPWEVHGRGADRADGFCTGGVGSGRLPRFEDGAENEVDEVEDDARGDISDGRLSNDA